MPLPILPSEPCYLNAQVLGDQRRICGVRVPNHGCTPRGIVPMQRQGRKHAIVAGVVVQRQDARRQQLSAGEPGPHIAFYVRIFQTTYIASQGLLCNGLCAPIPIVAQASDPGRAWHGRRPYHVRDLGVDVRAPPHTKALAEFERVA